MKVFWRISQFSLISLLIFGWIFSAWPQIFNFPPKIQIAYAVTLCERPSSTTDNSGGNTTWDNNGNSWDTSTCPGPDTTTSESFDKENVSYDSAVDWNWSASGNSYADLKVKVRITTANYNKNSWGLRYTTNGTSANTTNGAVLSCVSNCGGLTDSANNSTNVTGAVFEATISASQDLTQLKVGEILVKGGGGGDATADVQIYDVWVEGAEVSVSAPTVTTSAASSITTSSATLNGNVTNNGGEDATTCGFAWGTNSALSGGDTATTTDSTCPSGTGAFTKALSSLSDNTTYYFRAYGTNSGGSGYGSILNFMTNALVYSVSITSSGTVEYGFVELSTASSTVGNGYTQTAQNDGNTAEKLNVKSTNATGGTTWTLAGSIGSNQYTHEFSTTTGSTWTAMTAADTYVTAVPSIAVSGTANFDFRLTTPSSSSDYQQKSITITIQAVAP